jgi:hypothetical protein
MRNQNNLVRFVREFIFKITYAPKLESSSTLLVAGQGAAKIILPRRLRGLYARFRMYEYVRFAPRVLFLGLRHGKTDFILRENFQSARMCG